MYKRPCDTKGDSATPRNKHCKKSSTFYVRFGSNCHYFFHILQCSFQGERVRIVSLVLAEQQQILSANIRVSNHYHEVIASYHSVLFKNKIRSWERVTGSQFERTFTLTHKLTPILNGYERSTNLHEKLGGECLKVKTLFPVRLDLIRTLSFPNPARTPKCGKIPFH